jgi:methyltransferase
MVSVALSLALLAALGLERLYELRLSTRNAERALAQGGVEFGRAHFRVMALLHGTFLAACAAEVVLLQRPFHAWLGASMLGLAIAAQALRYWAIRTLGPRWNVRVIVVPGAPVVTGGPYRFLRHPNYVAVAVEGFAIPLIHGAWATALVFSIANGLLLAVRIRCEERALAAHCYYEARFGDAPRFVPRRAVAEAR